jgi:NodT family efflux transporter outer membrane factor (OMF) lipoprotein
MRLTRGALVAAAFSLAGLQACTVGPRYQPPAVVNGARDPWVSSSGGVNSAAQPPDDWWTLYREPQLDRFIQEAFVANTDLKAAEANLSAARAILEGVKAGRYPQTGAEVGATRGRDAVTDEILELGGHQPQTIWIFDALLDVSYEVDLFGHVRRSVEAARADQEAVTAARDAVKITVAAETTRAYAQVCALGEEIAVAQHSLDVVTREAQITARRHEAGANSEFDVVRAEGLVAQVQAGIPSLEGQRRAALFQLGAVLGRAPTHAPTEVLSCASPPRLAALIPVGDGAALLKRRPDVRQADRRLASATARIGIATADLYPRITLNGLLGGVSPQFNQLATNEGVTWGIGPQVTWEFPNQAAPRARIRQTQANARAALAQFDGTVLLALKETEQALSAYAAELDRRQALGVAQQKAQRAFDMAHGQFMAGALSTLELLTAEQSLVAADAAVATSDAALAQDQIAVFKALGGGWENAQP